GRPMQFFGRGCHRDRRQKYFRRVRKRSSAVLHCSTRQSRRRKRWRERFASCLRSVHGRESTVVNQSLQIFTVDRHPINRVVLFTGGFAEKENVVVVDPNAVPAETFFWREPCCFLRLKIERPERRERAVPIFAAGFLAHFNAQKQPLAVRRNIDPAIPA